MDSKNQESLIQESLIAELTDTDLANCVGGCGYINPGDRKIIANDGVMNAPGLEHNPNMEYDPNGSLRYRSDRHLKESIAEVDIYAILKGIANLPISTWQYKDQGETIRRIGPMAQDFAATFNLGESDRTINVVDAHGVAFAAIQALYHVVQQQESQINELQTQLLELKQQQQF
ncbi:tail fiber domain-containing protein [Nostoc linckia FACHB-104]|nr:tail fiber domain-containing protein [Nostoc linckia FACHB-104]